MPEEPAMNERWSSVDEVAEHLGVAPGTVCRWIGHRGLPAKKIGRLWKLELSEVDDWVNAGGADDAVHRKGEGGRSR
jgi:excisionase family DNA binding protein